MDNQRLLAWGFFGIMVYLTWQTWMQDYGPKPVAPTAPTTIEAPAAIDDGLDGLPEVDTADGDLPSVTSPATATAAEPAATDGELITVVTDVLTLTINTRGGTLEGAVMRNYPVAKDTPDDLITLLSTDPSNLGLVRTWIRADDQRAPDANSTFSVSQTEWDLGDADTLVVPLTWTDGAGITVEKRFTFNRGSYNIALEQTLTNDSAVAWSGDQVTQLRRRSTKHERSMFDVDSYSFDGPQIYDGKKAEKLDRDDLIDDGPYQITTDNGWFAVIQHHFLSAIVPTLGTNNIYQVVVRNNVLTASVIEAKQSVGAGETASFKRSLFVGPKLQSQLDEIHEELSLTVDYGWLVILSQPMFWLLAWVYGFVGNWGWSIIIVTFLIKLAFYRLSQSSGRSMAKMRELQPRMKSLQDRYKDDRQALSQAMMDLYKREKINPAAGCLPILIQMPFFLAFYWVLVESVEMRQAPFMLWITDLSTRDPYFILPLIMGAAMLFQQKLNPAPADPVQARVMQIMPIMFTVFFAFFPSGLVLYWVTNTLLSIAQQWKINQVVHKEALAAKAGKGKKGKKDKKADKD